ncbi:MAG: Bifunctional protein FolD protein [uncultured marine phage]|uniref:Bifunctional protein FolD protein n=1 Tax=uncultured marine phage TaxID=707152 RepID=A0A8D9FRG6_9VIRU|nr:MAG: Bifunctional protein FolD protein [uncultured marine phage]
MTNTVTLLDGRKVANDIKDDLRRSVKKLIRKPRMAVILVGENPASKTYVNAKVKACREIGIDCSLIKLPISISESELLSEIELLNQDSKIDGYIVQLPLPKHIDQNKIIGRIDPKKDIDGFHTENIGKMTLNIPTILPATPYGIMQLLRHYNIELEGKSCVVIGRSNIVGLPISIMMGHDDMCTVTSCHVNTQDLDVYTKMADIIIVSVGIPNFLTENMIKEDAVIVDVGINKVEDSNDPRGYKIVGDVDFDGVSSKSSYITPVPGGVGPMTIVSLMKNLIHTTKINIDNEYS